MSDKKYNTDALFSEFFDHLFGPKPEPKPPKNLDFRIRTDNGHIYIDGKFESLVINGKLVRFKK